MSATPQFITSALTVADNTQVGNTIVPADTTDLKSVVEGATDGTIIQDIVAVSDDTAAVILQVYFYDGATAWLIGSVNVPTLSGTDGVVPAVSLLNVVDLPFLNKRDDGAILLGVGEEIQVGAVATVTAAKTVTLTAIGGNL